MFNYRNVVMNDASTKGIADVQKQFNALGEAGYRLSHLMVVGATTVAVFEKETETPDNFGLSRNEILQRQFWSASSKQKTE